MLTSTQILYLGWHKTKPEYGEGACLMCGGKILLPHKPAPAKAGNNWTDTNLCKRRDSNVFCAACHWVMKNRNAVWKKDEPKLKWVVFATENDYKVLDIKELYTLLKTDFETPAVIMVRVGSSQKHISWRSLENITYNRNQTKITFFGIQGRAGSAIIDATELTSLVDDIIEQYKVIEKKAEEKHLSVKKKCFYETVFRTAFLTEFKNEQIALIADQMAQARTGKEGKK